MPIKNFIIIDPDTEEMYSTNDGDLYEKIKKYNNREGGPFICTTKPDLDEAIDAQELANYLGIDEDENEERSDSDDSDED